MNCFLTHKFPNILGLLMGLGLHYASVGTATEMSQDSQLSETWKACKLRAHSPDEITSLALCEADKAGIPAHLVMAVIEIESNFNIDAIGKDGEIGLMQIMPATARMLGYKGDIKQLKDPVTNVELGVNYLTGAHQLSGGDLCTTLMKYRAGHGETRFSVLSVEYCRRAIEILKREGIAVSVALPTPQFGFNRKTVGSDVSAGSCVRRDLVPGPRYGSCLISANTSKAKSVARLRRKLFE